MSVSDSENKKDQRIIGKDQSVSGKDQKKIFAFAIANAQCKWDLSIAYTPMFVEIIPQF